ncbi:MAG: helix-turn-helix domain-containing protein [Pseudomonadota bacterium]
MERKSFSSKPCSIARSLDVLGDWWNPLIIRECLYGVHRFDEFQRWLGIGRNILTRRLRQLVEQGLLEKRMYQEKPKRYEYHLTDKGYDSALVLLAMIPFGDRWYSERGKPPIQLYDRRTGKRVRPVLVDRDSGEPIDTRQVYAGPGKSFPAEREIRRERFVEFYARRAAR